MRFGLLTLVLIPVCTAVDVLQTGGNLNSVAAVGLPAAAILNKRDPVKNFYNITSGEDVLAFLASSGPMLLELVKVEKGGLKRYSPRMFYNMSGETNVTGSRTDDIVAINVSYKGGDQAAGFSVSTAEITLDVQTGGDKAPRTDYWLVTKAMITLTFTVNSTSETQTVDLTPKFGYTNRKADLACDAKHSVCAPLALTWTCTDQTFKSENYTALTPGSNTVILHVPGMKLQPFKAGVARAAFGYRWDCDPLLPLSIWVSVIITLLLASIVWWALSMLGSIYTPSKFDDPKGKSIQIPQGD
jgi:hypothetical protein